MQILTLILGSLVRVLLIVSKLLQQNKTKLGIFVGLFYGSRIIREKLVSDCKYHLRTKVLKPSERPIAFYMSLVDADLNLKI